MVWQTRWLSGRLVFLRSDTQLTKCRNPLIVITLNGKTITIWKENSLNPLYYSSVFLERLRNHWHTHRHNCQSTGQINLIQTGYPSFQTTLPTRQSVTVCLPIFAMTDRTESYLMGSGNKVAGMCKLKYASPVHFMSPDLALYVSLYHPLCYHMRWNYNLSKVVPAHVTNACEGVEV